MQLSPDILSELQKMKTDKQAKLQARRGEILNFIAVDAQYNVIVDPSFKRETKSILNDMDALQTGIKDVDILLSEIQDASDALGFNDFGQQRQRYLHTIQQSNTTLKKGIINEILSKAQCQDLEISVNTAQAALDKLNTITAPIIEKLEKLDQIR